MKKVIISFFNKNIYLFQLSKYSLIGLSTLIIDFIIYSVLQSLLEFSSSKAKIISFIIASINSFIFNRKITFNSKSKSIKEPFRFIILYLISLTFNSITHDFVYIYNQKNFPFLIATFVSVAINFNGQKYWVFKK